MNHFTQSDLLGPPASGAGLAGGRGVLRLIALRLVAATTLFGSALLIPVITEAPFPLIRPLFYVIVFVYGLSLLHLLAYIFLPWRNSSLLLYAQIAGDVATATWLVYLTGGVSSSFSFLYHIPILTASAMLQRRGAILTAGMDALAYGGLLGLTYWGGVPPFRPTDVAVPAAYLYYYASSNLAGFLMVALLSGYLSERMRRQDIALQQTSENLASLQALHRDIIESMAAGLMTGDADGKVLLANPAGLKLLGLNMHEVRGRQLTELLPGFPERMLAKHPPNFSTGEMYYPHPAGEQRVLALSVAPLSGSAPQGEWLLVLEDITDLRELEQRLRLKSRMAALGEMAAGLAHEIRNPLASIRGGTEMLAQQSCSQEEKDRLLRIIVEETKRLNRTIEAFLRYARGENALNPEARDLRELLDETLILVKQNELFQPGAHHMEAAAPGEPVICRVFADALRQVFWNLALNALKAMPGGGTLRVSLRQDAQRRTAEIVFSDNGRGISRQNMQRVMLPFYSSFPGGVGLGLAISYNIVDRHGGSLDIESEEGAGTSVTVRLPLAGSHAPAAPEATRVEAAS